MAAIYSIFQYEKEIISIDIFGSIRKWQIEDGKRFSISGAFNQESNVFGAELANEKIFISVLDRVEVFSAADFSRITSIHTDVPGLLKSTQNELIVGTTNVLYAFDLNTFAERFSHPGNITYVPYFQPINQCCIYIKWDSRFFSPFCHNTPKFPFFAQFLCFENFYMLKNWSCTKGLEP